MKKIAILYICTGKYRLFWDGFYKSCEKHFLKTESKQYFVFTDANDLSSTDNVSIINRKCQGFPNDSLFRFEMFLEIQNKLKDFDYVFFFNANMLIVKDVGNEIFPTKNFHGLIGVIHPVGYKYRFLKFMYPYEKNKNSLAYIKKFSKPKEYFMGGLNGGSVKEYLEMVEVCCENIRKDYDKGIIAIYHDESHLNNYFSNKQVHSLPTAYGFPEGSKLPFEPSIIIRNKIKLDSYFDKHSNETKIQKILRLSKRIIPGFIK